MNSPRPLFPVAPELPKKSKAIGLKARMKGALISWFDRVYGAFHRARGRGQARSLARHAASLPPEGLAELCTAIQAGHRMDYERHDIYLLVTSRPEKGRLRSAAKEPWTIQWIEEHVKPGDVVYDIGANVGAYALVAAKWTGGQARVYAFEPGCATYASLCKNVVLNHCQESITPLPVALAEETGLVNFKYRSLLAGDALHAMGDRLPGIIANGGSPAAWDQPMLGFRLDDLASWFGLPPPNHIKLDVDGAELSVLRGAAGLLSHPGLRTLMVEMNEDEVDPDELRKCLTAGGHHLACTMRRPGGKGPAYGLFLRQQHGSPLEVEMGAPPATVSSVPA